MTEMFRVRNPRNGQYDYQFPIVTPAEIAERATKLRAHSPVWSEMPAADRCAVLFRFAEA
ncbi:MAG: hypothetical protein ING51_03205, partial [Rhodocyclaceae bacterium]|nr:hypothetical protein [Rhodocyclaceae bacterium]